MNISLSKSASDDPRYGISCRDFPYVTLGAVTHNGYKSHDLYMSLSRADLESFILQLTGQLAKLDQDAETTKVVAK